MHGRLRAFSLMELMAVVGIIGVLASIAIPSISEITKRGRAREALVSVGVPFIEARGKAHGNLKCAFLSIDATAKQISYELFTCGTVPTGVPTKTFDFPTLTLSAFDGGSSSISFTTSGGLSSSSIAHMTATATTGQVAHVRIYPAIGQIEVDSK